MAADTNISMENRRVVALLNQHGDHEATPDFQNSYEPETVISTPRTPL